MNAKKKSYATGVQNAAGRIAVLYKNHLLLRQRYRKKIGKGAYKAVYERALDIEHNYRMEGDMENAIDCVRLQNLMNYFKDEICSEN